LAANLVGSATFLTAPGFISGKNMKKLNKGFIAVLVAGSIVNPAFAEQDQADQMPVLDEADYSAVFDSMADAVEVASLSTEEMKETEGALWWFLPVIGYTALGAGAGAAYSYAQNDGSVDWRDVGAGATGGFYASPVGRVVGGVGYGAGYLMGTAGSASWYSSSLNDYSSYGAMNSPSGAGYGGSGVGYLPY